MPPSDDFRQLMEQLPALDYVRGAALAVLLVWILAEFVKRRKRNQGAGRHGAVASVQRRGLPAHMVAFCNASITLSHVGFSVLGVWKKEALSLGLVFESASWLLATLLLLYCKHEGAGGGVSNWPAVLVSWWFFSFLLESLLISLHLLHLFDSATVVDFACLPFCTIICLVVVAMRLSKANQKEDLDQQPLLLREDSDDSSRDRFSSSGWWSQLTFRWLNPVFKKGHKMRLELEHIPYVPQSETAEQSYALLQETIHKQKPEPMPLRKAIICAVWTPLVGNAVFAGW
jgi:hypothetical protein